MDSPIVQCAGVRGNDVSNFGMGIGMAYPMRKKHSHVFATETGMKQACKLGRCDSYLQSETVNDPLTERQG